MILYEYDAQLLSLQFSNDSYNNWTMNPRYIVDSVVAINQRTIYSTEKTSNAYAYPTQIISVKRAFTHSPPHIVIPRNYQINNSTTHSILSVSSGHVHVHVLIKK